MVADNSHSPILYPAAVLRSSKYRLTSENFLDFLKTEAAQQYFIDDDAFIQIIFPEPCVGGCNDDCGCGKVTINNNCK